MTHFEHIQITPTQAEVLRHLEFQREKARHDWDARAEIYFQRLSNRDICFGKVSSVPAPAPPKKPHLRRAFCAQLLGRLHLQKW